MVSINPGSGAYGMFPNYDYTAWQALGEFLDNSISSFQKNRELLIGAHDKDFVLKLDVTHDPDKDVLEISDNAAGISDKDWQRAFSLAKPPEDLRFIGRYGVGMKAAALWFAHEFTVTTTALGEAHEKTLHWDNPTVVKEDLTELEEETRKVDTESHYTRIVLRRLIHPPQGKTITKIKSFLPHIYREFLRSGQVEITWNGELLSSEEPDILVAPPQWALDEEPREWEQKVVINMHDGRTIHGRVFVLANFKRSYTALNLFWHKRLIKGNIDPNHRPSELFGAPQSFETGRLCVDLHLDDYEPTIDKRGFKFRDGEATEEEIIKELKRVARETIRQANKYREPSVSPDDVPSGDSLAKAAEQIISSPSQPTPARPYPQPIPHVPSSNEVVAVHEFDLWIHNEHWRFQFRLGSRASDNKFVDIGQIDSPEASSEGEGSEPHHTLTITLGHQHPYVNKFWGSSRDVNEVLYHLAAAVAYAEIAAVGLGAENVTFVRSNIDSYLRFVAQNL